MNRYNKLRYLFFLVIMVLIFVRSYTSILRYGYMFHEGWSELRATFQLFVEMSKKYSLNKTSFLSHTYLGFIYSILLLFQIYPREKIKNIKIHKVRGVTLLLLLHVVIGIAFFLSFNNSMFGPNQMSFLSTIWIILILYTIFGFIALRKKDIYTHSCWMRRLAILSMGPSGQIIFINLVYYLGFPQSYLQFFTSYSSYFGYYSLILLGEILLYFERQALKMQN